MGPADTFRLVPPPRHPLLRYSEVLAQLDHASVSTRKAHQNNSPLPVLS